MADHPLISKNIFESSRASRIYVLPNLMTAGNLFCGFLSVICCIQAHTAVIGGDIARATELHNRAAWLILAAIIFDALDGRLARLGGRESLFGKEFDSLADVVSFGTAPALLVFSLNLGPTARYPLLAHVGWFIGFIYLLCAAIRLARFNVLTHPAVYSRRKNLTKDFIGLPTPAAAGTTASLVFFINEWGISALHLLLPPLMLLTSCLMVSGVRYPCFKEVDWRTRLRFRAFILLFAIAILIWEWWHTLAAAMFLSYLFYGIFTHSRVVSARRQRMRVIEKERPQLVKKVKKTSEQPDKKKRAREQL